MGQKSPFPNKNANQYISQVPPWFCFIFFSEKIAQVHTP